ncbi:hypothetical protein MUK42_15099 [Musa troglodytarum]|uniref:Uncharacterized protein n=1 Tax=Musa troglodytarum TaxID=320322 RepID=A0A9E7I2B0_9LILI|nr:hypothetical protein MUK42_15099 [Musa troglodytarum]
METTELKIVRGSTMLESAHEESIELWWVLSHFSSLRKEYVTSPLRSSQIDPPLSGMSSVGYSLDQLPHAVAKNEKEKDPTLAPKIT